MEKFSTILLCVLILSSSLFLILPVDGTTNTNNITLNSENFTETDPPFNSGSVTYQSVGIMLSANSIDPPAWYSHGVRCNIPIAIDSQVAHIETQVTIAPTTCVFAVVLNKELITNAIAGDTNPNIKTIIGVENFTTHIRAYIAAYANGTNQGSLTWNYPSTTEEVTFNIRFAVNPADTTINVNQTYLADVRSYNTLDQKQNYLYYEASTYSPQISSLTVNSLTINYLKTASPTETPWAVVTNNERLFNTTTTNYGDDPSIIQVNSTLWYMYTTGSRLFKSNNLYDWTFIWANPIHGQGAAKDCAILRDGVVYLFYEYVDWSQPMANLNKFYLSTCKIEDIEHPELYAYKGTVLNATAPINAIQAPYIFQHPNGTWFMYFYYQTNPTDSFIGLATSQNLESGWTYYPNNPVLAPTGLELHDVSPCVFPYNGSYYMLYNAFDSKSYSYLGEFGHGFLCLAESEDLINWNRIGFNPLIAPGNFEQDANSMIFAADVVINEGMMYYFYNYQHHNVTEYSTLAVNFEPNNPARLYNISGCKVTSAQYSTNQLDFTLIKTQSNAFIQLYLPTYPPRSIIVDNQKINTWLFDEVSKILTLHLPDNASVVKVSYVVDEITPTPTIEPTTTPTSTPTITPTPTIPELPITPTIEPTTTPTSTPTITPTPTIPELPITVLSLLFIAVLTVIVFATRKRGSTTT